MSYDAAPHDTKRQLVEAILAKAQEASRIDERISLRDCTPEKVKEWYETTMPLATDVETVWRAFRIELEMHYGEMVLHEPEQRGRPADIENLVPRTTFSKSEVDRRSRARILAENKPAVQDYYKAAGRTATRKGALRHVKQVTTPKAAALTSMRSTPQIRPAKDQDRILSLLEKVADGKRRKDPELERMVGQVKNFLKWLYLVPWLTIDRTTDGTTFTINQTLRDTCDHWESRPLLEGFSIRDFLKYLRAEILRRRKANHDERRNARWSTQGINSREQTDLLNWIETELDRIP